MPFEAKHGDEVSHVDQAQLARNSTDRVCDDFFLLGGKGMLFHERAPGIVEFGLAE